MSEQLNGTSESKFEHTYDTNIVYHSHASNVPHLNGWIDELVSMTERASRKFTQRRGRHVAEV